MRFNINLATQPYEDSRRFMLHWSAVLGALLLLSFLLGFEVFSHWRAYLRMTRDIAREQTVIHDLDEQQSEDIAVLKKPENAEVRDRSDFLNGLIKRKQVSWTLIFSDLEKLMPPHLRVLAVQPKVQDDQILVNLDLGGDSRDRAAELVRRMEKSNIFRYAQVVSETDNRSLSQSAQSVNGEDPLRFQVTAEYVPENGGHAIVDDAAMAGGK